MRTLSKYPHRSNLVGGGTYSRAPIEDLSLGHVHMGGSDLLDIMVPSHWGFYRSKEFNLEVSAVGLRPVVCHLQSTYQAGSILWMRRIFIKLLLLSKTLSEAACWEIVQLWEISFPAWKIRTGVPPPIICTKSLCGQLWSFVLVKKSTHTHDTEKAG